MSQRQIIQGEKRCSLFKHRERMCGWINGPAVFSVLFAVFEQYQKSRMQFVKTVADLATRSQNIEFLQNAGKEIRRN